MSNSEQANRVEPFDVLEHANIQNPFPLFAKLRSEAPVYWSRKYSFWMGFGSANHDAEEFRDPETLDVTRKKVQSLAFGYGIHTCVGSALARMETQVAFSQLLKRFSRIQLLTDGFDYHPVYFLRALKSLPVAVNA